MGQNFTLFTRHFFFPFLLLSNFHCLVMKILLITIVLITSSLSQITIDTSGIIGNLLKSLDIDLSDAERTFDSQLER